MASIDIYGDMIDETLTTSLPAQVAALTEARKENAAEVARLQAILENLEKQYFKGKQEKDRITVKVNNLLTKLCALEEEGCKSKVHIELLEKEISENILVNQNLLWMLKQKEEECSLAQKTYSEYCKKMDLMKELVVVQKENADMITKKEELERNYNKFLQEEFSGKAPTDIQKEIADLEASVEDQKALLNEKNATFQAQHQNRKQKEIDNIILQKKNAALLKRLKHQVQELRDVNKQLTMKVKMELD